MREFKFVKAESGGGGFAVEVGVAVGGYVQRRRRCSPRPCPRLCIGAPKRMRRRTRWRLLPRQAVARVASSARAKEGRGGHSSSLLRALEQAGRADGTNQQGVSDGDARLTYRVLSALHAAGVAIDAEVNDTYDDDDDGKDDFDDEAALVYAARALSSPSAVTGRGTRRLRMRFAVSHPVWSARTAPRRCREAAEGAGLSRRARGDTHGRLDTSCALWRRRTRGSGTSSERPGLRRSGGSAHLGRASRGHPHGCNPGDAATSRTR